MNITNQYYNEHAQSFFDTTVNVDVQKLYDRFLPRINDQGKILDAGCGSGRDSKNFLNLAYKVSAFDANEALAELASKHLGQAVTQASFESFNAEPNSFDGIWACASLLHVPSDALPRTLSHLSELLKPSGVFYCSFKYGKAEQVRNGRFFTDMNEKSLSEALSTTKLKIEETWISSDARPGREAEKWLNAILVRV
ncbi:Tellurite resistance protein TehB [Vibrio sp. B1FLJ16]|uniref:class I SAM-dependent methyltransferase n=1 Tax=Vibrio sp. B1FLJ16 TaxID=2751178 RepID=UPI001AF4E74D|nr:Tellurite resistance protein TehB [Vibrio sp. B1FLJ16]CAE6951291.1 Tellurite resistance protein TehB [Vibrio sp. B1FLJ16]